MKTTVQLLAGMCVLFLAACGLDSTTPESTEASLESFPAEQGSCGPENKIDEEGPQDDLSCAAGEVVSYVCVKAANQCFCADSDEEGPCYTFEGIGTSSASVSGGGTGRDCQMISHTEWDCEEGQKCPPDQKECMEDKDCDTGDVCVDGCCEPEPPKCPPDQKECMDSKDCASDEACLEGCCVLAPK